MAIIEQHARMSGAADIGVALLARIADRGVVAGVSQAWQVALERSPYDSMEDVPQNPRAFQRSLVSHVNEVAAQCAAQAAIAEESGIAVDLDTLLAAAILHDIDKALLYRVVDGRFEWAPEVSPSDHGPLGADIAAECGLSAQICDLIRFHSPFSPHGPGADSIESAVLHHADLIASDISMIAAGFPPLCARTHIVRDVTGTNGVRGG